MSTEHERRPMGDHSTQETYIEDMLRPQTTHTLPDIKQYEPPHVNGSENGTGNGSRKDILEGFGDAMLAKDFFKDPELPKFFEKEMGAQVTNGSGPKEIKLGDSELSIYPQQEGRVIVSIPLPKGKGMQLFPIGEAAIRDVENGKPAFDVILPAGEDGEVRVLRLNEAGAQMRKIIDPSSQDDEAAVRIAKKLSFKPPKVPDLPLKPELRAAIDNLDKKIQWNGDH